MTVKKNKIKSSSFLLLLQLYDYKYFLPFLARLPIGMGRKLALVRGFIHALLDYDWRSNTLGFFYIRKRVMDFMGYFSDSPPVKGTLQRFMTNSLEEWQSYLFSHKNHMKFIASQDHIQGIDRLKELAEQKRGVVLLSTHFDSFCMGMVLFGMHGLKVNMMITAAIEDPRIDSSVRQYFQDKYKAMELHMNGKTVCYEYDLDFFYKALARGEIVVLLGDVPGGKSSLYIDFLEKRFQLPLGAWHMAKKTGSLIGAYVTLGYPGGKYESVCIPPMEVHPDDPLCSLMPSYRFLESWIRKMPEKWVASDLWEGY